MKFLANIARKVLGRSNGQTTPAAAPEQATAAPQPGAKRVITHEQHNIDRRRLDENASKVVYRLTDAGHEGYLVGGCIRDLLMGQRPKDFDVATSAHPEEAHELFRRSRLIGRRFKLLHVRFGREIIEVATFRASHDQPENGAGDKGRQHESGLILRDNVYGTLAEDALRRDFTVNGLYYDLNDHSIIDFADGYEDLQNRTIRMIGEPDARYREDPVRMLRAVRFAEVVVVLLDAQIPFETQDLRIADLAEREGRAVVVAVNKWDVEDNKQEKLRDLKEAFGRLLPQLRGAPLITVSAKTGKGLERLHDAIMRAYDVWNRRIPTAALNRWLTGMLEQHPPPAPQGKRIKLRYMTQAKTRPPGFVVMCSHPDKIPASYTRYLVNGLRQDFDMPGTPIRLTMRGQATRTPIRARRKPRLRNCANILRGAGTRDRINGY